MKSPRSDKYITPIHFFNELNNEFHFDNFDPCPIDYEEGITPNGLEIEWTSRTFCNPPYSNTKVWIEKSYIEWNKNKLVVLLLDANITSTIAFHQYIYHQNNIELRFIKGRLSFAHIDHLDKKLKQYPHASILIIMRPTQ